MSTGNNDSYMYFSAFDKSVRNIYFYDKDMFIVLSGIIFQTNFTEQYEKLNKNESYFSYTVFEQITRIKRKKLQNIMKKLEEQGYIEWIFKSKSKFTQSIIHLNYEFGKGYGKGYSRGYGRGYSGGGYFTDDLNDLNIVHNTENDTREDILSKNISKNISILKQEDIINKDIDESIIGLYIKYNSEELYYEQRQFIYEFVDKYSLELVKLAISESAYREKLFIPYIKSVLEDWRIKGVTSKDEAIVNLNAWKERNKISKEKYEKSLHNKGRSNKNNIKYNSFNNFEPRQYDYESLERKLLGWDIEDDRVE